MSCVALNTPTHWCMGAPATRATNTLIEAPLAKLKAADTVLVNRHGLRAIRKQGILIEAHSSRLFVVLAGRHQNERIPSTPNKNGARVFSKFHTRDLTVSSQIS